MVRVRVRVIRSYDITLYMSTAVRIKLQTVVLKFSPTSRLDYCVSLANYFGGKFLAHQIMAWLAFYLFVSSNKATKQPDDVSDVGQLVTSALVMCYKQLQHHKHALLKQHSFD